MQIIGDILVGILTVYLGFTNGIAGLIEPTVDTPIEASPTTPEQGGFLESLPSSIGSQVPDILLRSAAYQSAALAAASEPLQAGTSDPLDALVNIFCTYTTNEYIRTTTGTGFFIDTDGVIMSNAHVAQFLLYEEESGLGDTDCTVRTGNPASPRYTAELLYLPPAWVQENASVIHDEVPMGTGERDYALLYVNGSVDAAPLPERFPALSIDTALLPVSLRGDTVTAAGYPAGNLLANGPSADLVPVQAETPVSELYTFGSNYADVIAVRGSAVGAEGASGGPILNESGDVIGLIVTRGNDATDGAGSLRAITLSHVDRTIKEETGFSLTENLSGDLAYRADVFATSLSPFLLSILEQQRPIE